MSMPSTSAMLAMVMKPLMRAGLLTKAVTSPRTENRYIRKVAAGAITAMANSVKTQRGSQRGSRAAGRRCTPTKTISSSTATPMVRASSSKKLAMK